MFQQLFRVFRVVQHERYRAWWLLLVTAGLLSYGTWGFYTFEGDQEGISSVWDAAWWAIVTMTTVGYGDLYPLSWQGRWLVAVPLMILGIGVLGYAIGTLTTWVIERHSKEIRGMLPFTGQGHVIICNCPGVDTVLGVIDEIRADTQWAEREIVLISERLEELPEELRKKQVHFVRGNASRESVLQQAGIANASHVVIIARDPRDPGSDNHTLGIVVTINALKPEVHIVAECGSQENKRLLENAGADEVVGVGVLSAGLLVQGLQDPGVNGVLADLVTNQTGHQIYVAPIEQYSGNYAGLEAALGKHGRYVSLGLVGSDGHQFLPDPETKVQPGQRVMLIGTTRPGVL